jgi:hypothetical protein
MSWSVGRTGRAGAVAKALAEDFARIKCVDPEETVKNGIATAVAAALAAFPAGEVVQVSASGSQHDAIYNAPESGKINSLSVMITPIYNFLD